MKKEQTHENENKNENEYDHLLKLIGSSELVNLQFHNNL